MAAYAAVVTLKINVEEVYTKLRPCFSHPSLELLESALKQAKSFQEFVEGLGGGSRRRMDASLQRFAETVRKFMDVLVKHFSDQQYTQQHEIGEEGVLHSLEVENLTQEFHVIFEMMKEIKKERFNGDGADFDGGNKSKLVGSSYLYNFVKQELVVERLNYNTNIVLIFGMAGVGKTTFVEAIYQDLDVLEWFERRVWVSVGKKCPLEEIPRRILAQLDSDSAQKLMEGDGDVGPYFEEILKGKRYLIVLDDVWDARVCGHLKTFLPNSKEGCRVILTSRSRRAIEETRCVGQIQLLNEKESWILLRERLFGGKYCPPELEKIGKMIAEKCDGLPLTIVTIADLLLKIPEPLWIDVATQRKHQIFIDAYQEISKVLYPSYEDLSQQLKLCFVYMAVFPPKFNIPRTKLVILWYIEGLLESCGDKSEFECAIQYLEELSLDSLIMVNQKSMRSSLSLSVETKSCALHSSWWHLCYTEARRNNFFYVLISREDRLGKGIKSQSRLSIHNNVLFAIKDVFDSVEKNSAFSACSLLCLGLYHQYPVPICFGLRFLKTLDALTIRLYEFPLEVLKLMWLKYLALTCDGELPASISRLQNLKFFIVQQHHNIKLRGALAYMPVEIWDMEELEVLQVMGSDLRDDSCDTILPNLWRLLDVSPHSCTKGIFRRVPHIAKLGIQIELTPGVVEPLRCFDHISLLSRLKVLKCVVANFAECESGIVSLPTSISIFPFGLAKLTLSGLGFPWDEMSKIAFLPCLEVLKLRCNAFRGPIWEVEENKFKKLKFLVIEDNDIMQWKVGRGSFKELILLSIKHCYKFKEVHLGSEVNLGRFEVVDSNPSLEYVLREALLRRGHIPGQVSVQSSWEVAET